MLTTRRYSGAARFAVLASASALFLVPFLIMLVGAGKSREDLVGAGWGVFNPQGFTSLKDNLANAVASSAGQPSFFASMRTSLIVTVVTVLLGLIVNSLAGYALARSPIPGRAVAVSAVVGLLIVPFEAIAVPLFVLSVQPVAGYRLSDTVAAQILPFVAQPLHIFLFYSFFKSLPVELEEAAQIDGAGSWRTFRSVIAPLAGPAYASSAILMGLQMWGQYLWPLMVASGDPERSPLPLGLQQGFLGTTPDWGGFYAYATLMVLPVVALFLALQRWFVQGIAASGVKG
ncbi:MAG: carbohydrate ABC transporter permease [Angustibacter sp.]